MKNLPKDAALLVIALAVFFIFLVKTGYFSSILQPTDIEITGEPPSASSIEERGAAARLVMGRGIDINTASADELELLPGIGRALAARIVEKRAELGGFSSKDELAGVSGIGAPRLEAIRGYIEVDSGG